jgi:hypothetical protein
MEQAITTNPAGAQPAPPTAPKTEIESLPALPCPNCGANILEHRGFYNYCSETQSLCEHNYLSVFQDRIYVEHDEGDYETTDHECAMEARCTKCDEVLPWALYQIRELDGEKLADAPRIIAGLLAEIEDGADETAKEQSA